MRLPDEEIQRRFEENKGRCKISDEEALERWPDVAPQERARRKNLAEIAAARYATIVDDDTGQRMMGGAQPNSGKGGRKKSVVEKVAELADGERQKEVIDALFAPLASSEPAAVRGKGAERIIKMRIEHEEMERRDREELRQLGKEELADRLIEAITKGGMAQAIFSRVAQGLPAADVELSDADVIDDGRAAA